MPQRMNSQPEIRRPLKGMCELNGVTWDDANAAGGSIRGSDGRFLGQ
jgi:hypothetical protein